MWLETLIQHGLAERPIDDVDVIAACREELQELYGKGEDLLTYLQREIAPLPSPNAGG